jgi:hypothetical protein
MVFPSVLRVLLYGEKLHFQLGQDTSDNTFPNTVVAITETVRNKIEAEYQITDHDKFPWKEEGGNAAQQIAEVRPLAARAAP